jgi:hypothetical protein
MAEAIRREHRLLTVRIVMMPTRGENQIRFESFHGDEHLLRRDVPADAVGILPKITPREYQGVEFHLVDDVASSIAQSLHERRTDPTEPMWLQVGPSSGHLAAVPWERLLQPALGGPVLRIPNFLADPIFLSGRLRVALCVSSPRAKMAFHVPSYTEDLVDAVQQAVPTGTVIHVFADMDAYYQLQSLAAHANDEHSLIVHDPMDAERFGVGDVDRTLSSVSDRLNSPWLLWMHSALASEAVDVVHFICPGYFSPNEGALALARSPTRNVDADWSHFVGPRELISLFDLIGAWCIGLSPPHENVWAIGLRILADNLAWLRPGPLLLHDAEAGSKQDLVDAYRFLFSHAHSDPPNTATLMLYSHPRRIDRYAVEGSTFTSAGERGLARLKESPVFELLEKLSFKADRGVKASETEIDPAWIQSGRLQMDQLLLRIGDQDEATMKGMTEGLERFSRLLNEPDFEEGS